MKRSIDDLAKPTAELDHVKPDHAKLDRAKLDRAMLRLSSYLQAKLLLEPRAKLRLSP